MTPQPVRRLATLAAILAVVCAAFVAGRATATPRSAAIVIPTGQIGSPLERNVPSGNPSQLTGALRPVEVHGAPSQPVAGSHPALQPMQPMPAPTGREPDAVFGGLAAYAERSFGPRYLALPDGPGLRVRICGPAACVLRVSTDAGPDLGMQRAGRVADLSYPDFGRVCGCVPEVLGLVRVSITELGPAPTLPATDQEETP